MPHTPKWRRYLRFWRADVAADVDDELRFHFEARAAELRGQGLAAADAERTIAEEFGDVVGTRRQLEAIGRRRARRHDGLRWWHEVQGDVRYAARGLRRQPAFTAAALLTLALGIGLGTLMLTVARAAFVHAVPFADPARLVHVWERREADRGGRVPAAYPDFDDWRGATHAFAMLEGYDDTNVTLTGVGEPARLQAARVTPGFLAMLGVAPALGRTLTADDADAPVVVVSHAVWRQRLGSDPAAVGRPITIDGRALVVVGVLPRDFLFALAGDMDVWMPLDRGDARKDLRGAQWLRVIGRLRAGVPAERATAELAAVMRRAATEHPATNAGRTAYAMPVREAIVGPTRPLLLALGGMVALVFLVACANVASLFLARALARAQEMAVRAALGARRGRIVRQLLTESVLVAAMGGALGTAFAWAAVRSLAGGAPPPMVGRMPFLRALAVDAEVLGATLAVALVAGVALGLAPALHAGRLSHETLRRRDVSGAIGSGARRTLVVAELALTTVLLVGAGLMTRSVVALLRVDPGFRTEQVATMRLALAGPRYADPATQQRFFETLTERVRTLPGVRDAGAATNVPLVGGGAAPFRVEGAPEPDPAARPQTMLRGVAGDYFRTMGIRLLAGRTVDAHDDSSAVPAMVVSAQLARQLFGTASPLGRQLRFYPFPATAWTIVGVAADVRAAGLDAAPPPTAYYSHLQRPENRMTVVARATGDPASLLAAMRREAQALDPLLPVYQPGTMAEQVASTPAVYVRRSLLALFGGFAAAATVLAAVGVYGVIAYATSRRGRELGVRAALGASRWSLVGLVVRQGAALAAGGIGAGLVASAALAGGVRALLYEVRTVDVLTYGMAAGALAVVALATTFVPAWRASRVRPTDALRAE